MKRYKEIEKELDDLEKETFNYLKNYTDEYGVETAQEVYKKVHKIENSAEYEAGVIAGLRFAKAITIKIANKHINKKTN